MLQTVVFMFSGQGSHYYHMGKSLFESNPVFRKSMLELDTAAVKVLEHSVIDVLYDIGIEKGAPFKRILYSHPAIFMVEYSLAQALINEGIRPDFVLGTSMGEYAAAAVAGVMSPESLLHCLIRQAQLLESLCESGGMLAIMDNPGLFENIKLLNKNVEMAAVNYSSHFVVTGENEVLDEIESFAKKRGVLFQRLPVSVAFHSACIEPIALPYLNYLKGNLYRHPTIPIISCVNGKALNAIEGDYLWDVVRKPIKITKAIETLEELGAHIYIDLGQSGTMGNFIKRNLGRDSRSSLFSIITPFDQEIKNIENIKEYIKMKNLTREERNERHMVTYIFPGQGSQQKGMGNLLFDEFPDITRSVDEILGYSIKELCLEDPKGLLGQTQYTQPALYVVNALTYLKAVKEKGCRPDYVAGHSLGEYNALFAAGAFSFETGLKLVKKRGELMSLAKGGGMAAVLGFSEEKINEVLLANGLKDIGIANYNTPSQIVISGLKEDIEKAKPIFEAAGVRLYSILRVSGAFHSKYMRPARQEFEDYIKDFDFSPMVIPVISNVYARPYRQGDVSKTLVEQITNSVKWTESIRYLMGKGEMEFEEIGSGKVLAGLVRNIRKEAEPLLVDEVEEQKSEALMEIAAAAESDKSTVGTGSGLTAESLGDKEFKKDYNLKYAYISGGMYRGIASREMVVKMGRAGMMGFFGTGGLELGVVEEAIQHIQRELTAGQAYGMNLLYNPGNSEKEEKMVEMYIRYKVRNVEAAAYMSITPALVRYRLKGLKRNDQGEIHMDNRILAKLSRPEVAEVFLSPAPQRIVDKLLADNKITAEEAELARYVPMADDIIVEADSGGHTDHGIAYALMPAIIKMRNDAMKEYGYAKRIRVGAAGGIGTPEAAAAAFILGADFIATGSINQCTVEAATSPQVKELLQQANVQDTEYAPAGDMFEMGAKIQVLKKGVFFPARANKLYDLYRQYNSLDEIDEKTRKQIEEKYFKRSFESIYNESKAFYPAEEVEKAEKNPKNKMSMVFKWYYYYSTQLALTGNTECRVDYQVHCGPAMGAFNEWVKGTPLENWENRHVDGIAQMLMNATADMLNERIRELMQ